MQLSFLVQLLYLLFSLPVLHFIDYALPPYPNNYVKVLPSSYPSYYHYYVAQRFSLLADTYEILLSPAQFSHLYLFCFLAVRPSNSFYYAGDRSTNRPLYTASNCAIYVSAIVAIFIFSELFLDIL